MYMANLMPLTHISRGIKRASNGMQWYIIKVPIFIEVDFFPAFSLIRSFIYFTLYEVNYTVITHTRTHTHILFFSSIKNNFSKICSKAWITVKVTEKTKSKAKRTNENEKRTNKNKFKEKKKYTEKRICACQRGGWILLLFWCGNLNHKWLISSLTIEI